MRFYWKLTCATLNKITRPITSSVGIISVLFRNVWDILRILSCNMQTIRTDCGYCAFCVIFLSSHGMAWKSALANQMQTIQHNMWNKSLLPPTHPHTNTHTDTLPVRVLATISIASVYENLPPEIQLTYIQIYAKIIIECAMCIIFEFAAMECMCTWATCISMMSVPESMSSGASNGSLLL